MPFQPVSLTDLAKAGYDAIIDVRSPAEFAEDHVPGAINLPVLSNEERARVGTIYVQEDRFLARKVGAALVARNAAAHLEGVLADRPGGWSPLVYCWRGGQRSGSFASILAQIGWRVDTLEGGYRAYRRLVSDMLHDRPLAAELVVIDGGTGTGKTRLLHHIAAQGGQVLDLEALAEHRGSVFGPTGAAQPSQKAFESRVANALAQMDPARPVHVEAESSRIGRLNLPPSLWRAMRAAPSVQISAPLEARAAHLVESYPDFVSDLPRLGEVLNRLIRYHGHAQVDAWKGQAGAGDFTGLAADLIARHYDPRYARPSRKERGRAKALSLTDLSEVSLADAARRILSG